MPAPAIESSAVVQRKRALRAQAMARRDALDPAERARIAQLVAAAPLPFPVFRGEVFSAYAPMRSEFDPRPLAAKIVAAGGRIVLPAIVAGELVFREHDPNAPLAAGVFGTSEPPPTAPVLDPDVLLVPLLAFDRRGGRLGYGKGFYDRAIARVRASRRCGTVGLAFEAQRVEEIPLTPNDQRLDLILTEAGAHWVEPSGKKA
jgi:5-formyltetrahydrofolate cyclo-ligase